MLWQWPEENLNWTSHDKLLLQSRALTHPFIAWHVVHEPLEAALGMSFDPIIRWQGVLTFNNPPWLGPGSVFSSLSSPPTHCIFLTGAGYQTRQGKIVFVLLPMCKANTPACPFWRRVLNFTPSETSETPLTGLSLDRSLKLSHLGLRS